MKSTTKKDLDVISFGPDLLSLCFLGKVTGLLFCFYVKIFASSVNALFGY